MPPPEGVSPLTGAEFWSACCDICPGFAPSFAAYAHCRSRGWLLRSGLQYGATHVLYPQHPSLAHSTLCALVVPPPFGGPGCTAPQAGATAAGWPLWPELQALSRLCVQVNKGLLILHVVVADDGVPQPGASSVGAWMHSGAAAGGGGAHGRAGPPPPSAAAIALSRLRVIESEVTRFNPNKGRVEVTVLGEG